MIEETYNKLKKDRYFYWLGLDSWGIEHAVWLFLEIDPDYVEDDGKDIHTLRLLSNSLLIYSFTRDGEIPFSDEVEQEAIDELNKFTFVFHKYIKLLRSKDMGATEEDLLCFRASPSFWINKALEKKIEISWLELVIQKGYYNPKVCVDLIEKKLTNRERETLLILIAALAKEAKIDIAKISKAGELIANMTQLIGTPVGATTIETHLKKIPDSLLNRMK